MTRVQRRTPAMIAWLLSRVGSGEWLVGDIVEEHRRGRSSLWLGTQLCAAIVIGAWKEIRTHRLIVMSGIATGFASLWCLAALATLLLIRVGFPHAVDWRWPQGLVVFAVSLVYAAVSGWIVGRVHRTQRVAAVFSFLISVLIVLVVELPLLYWLAPAVFYVTVVPMLPMALIATYIGAPVAILTGGFWDSPRRQSPHFVRQKHG